MALHLNGISTPLSSERVTSFSYPRFPTMVRTRNALPARVKAVAERKESLDDLQRVSHNQQRQSQPKRRPYIASTGLWNRFPTARTVQQMMETMERMMEDPFAYNSALPLASEGVRNGYGQGRTPWAIEEREMDYKMRFDMPGMTKNDVKVLVEENMLVVKAEKVPNSRDGQENVSGIASEEEEWLAKSYGRYSSRIALPDKVEFEKIKAEVKDGVLYITVPKASVGSKIIGIDVQ
ncbi:hypothetical protein SLE2022_281390 [Rubroshorea leprosula]